MFSAGPCRVPCHVSEEHQVLYSVRNWLHHLFLPFEVALLSWQPRNYEYLQMLVSGGDQDSCEEQWLKWFLLVHMYTVHVYIYSTYVFSTYVCIHTHTCVRPLTLTHMYIRTYVCTVYVHIYVTYTVHTYSVQCYMYDIVYVQYTLHRSTIM